MKQIFLLSLSLVVILGSSCATGNVGSGFESISKSREQIRGAVEVCKKEAGVNEQEGPGLLIGPAIVMLPFSLAVAGAQSISGERFNNCMWDAGYTMQNPLYGKDGEPKRVEYLFRTGLLDGKIGAKKIAITYCGEFSSPELISQKDEEDLSVIRYRCVNT